jgi:spermidine/putrescine transport system substrate-binding protein
MKAMNKDEILDRLAAGKLTRRQFGRALGAAGLAMVQVPLLARGGIAAAGIEYFAWEGYQEPNFHKAYTEKYGEPRFSNFAGIEEALQKMLAGYRPDVAHPCTDNTIRWRDAGVLKPLDTSRLTNYADLWDELKTVPGVVLDGTTYLAPFDWGNTSIIYRADLVEIEEESWTLLFDERYAGKLSVQNTSDHAVIAAGLALGVKNVFAMTDDELKQVEALLVKQRPMLRYYWDDMASMEQGLASGEIVASTAWNETLVRLTQQGLNVKYMNPKEGILTWVCGLAIIAGGTGDEQAAYDFINAMQAPESGQYMIENWGYGHSNKKSFAAVKPERLSELGFNSPADLFQHGLFFVEVEPTLKERYNKLFEQVKAGM